MPEDTAISNPFKAFISSIYGFSRRAVAGRGFSKYRFLRNLSYQVTKLIAEKPKEFISIGGYKLFLDARNTYTEAMFDEISTNFLMTFLKPGDTVVDVGAHIGWFSLIASRAVGSAGKVFSFEPTKQASELLKKNIAVNQCANVVIEQAAVSDSSGPGVIYTIGDLWNGSTLINPEEDPDFWITPHLSDFEDKTIHHFQIPKITLDEYFGDQRVDFVKIDTEGNDGKVWMGMQNIVRKNPSLIVRMEFSPSLLKKSGTSPAKLLGDIKKAGFHIFTSWEDCIKPLSADDVDNFSGDLIFTRRDIRDEIFSLSSQYHEQHS